jgi:PAS domain S-box-containing protein
MSTTRKTKKQLLDEVALLRHQVADLQTRESIHQWVEDTMWEIASKFRHLAEGSLQGIVIHSHYKPLFVNQAYADIHGFRTPEAILRLDSLLPLYAPSAREHLLRSTDTELREHLPPTRRIYQGMHRDGALLWLESREQVVSWEGEPAVQATIVDITERKHAEEALQRAHALLEQQVQKRTAKLAHTVRLLRNEIQVRQHTEAQLSASHEQLQALSNHLLSVQEEERTRISREIHDELGQLLTALKLDVNWLTRHFAPQQRALLQKTQRMSALLDHTVTMLRRIAADLRPSELDHFGLVDAMEEYLERYQERTNLVCTLHIDPPDLQLDPDRSTTLFRVFQEALTNVARHAQATEVAIELTGADNALCLTLHDNGIGIPDDKLVPQGSLGLLGMRERVRAWDGSVTITRHHTGGTIVKVRLPMPETLHFRKETPYDSRSSCG